MLHGIKYADILLSSVLFVLMKSRNGADLGGYSLMLWDENILMYYF